MSGLRTSNLTSNHTSSLRTSKNVQFQVLVDFDAYPMLSKLHSKVNFEKFFSCTNAWFFSLGSIFTTEPHPEISNVKKQIFRLTRTDPPRVSKNCKGSAVLPFHLTLPTRIILWYSLEWHISQLIGLPLPNLRPRIQAMQFEKPGQVEACSRRRQSKYEPFSGGHSTPARNSVKNISTTSTPDTRNQKPQIPSTPPQTSSSNLTSFRSTPLVTIVCMCSN